MHASAIALLIVLVTVSMDAVESVDHESVQLEVGVGKFSQHLKDISVNSMGVDVLQKRYDDITEIINASEDIDSVMANVVDKFTDRWVSIIKEVCTYHFLWFWFEIDGG